MVSFSDILLTVDYDRTLTAPDSTIPESNLEAIREFMALGGAFTVNTGRSVPMARSFLDKVPTNAPLLLYNGAAAYDVKQEKLLFAHEINLDLWKTIREVIALFPDLTVEVQALDKHYNFVPDPAWDALSANNCAYGTAQPDQDLGPFLKFALYKDICETTVEHLFRGTPELIRRMDEVETLLNQLYAGYVTVTRAGPRMIDVQARGVNKGSSARELQQQLGRNILVCVGDAENDEAMLSGADYAFVPADAFLKDRYENVCCCADGAVADVIYEKIPRILNLELDKRGESC